jgi:hypothetical protein
MTKPTEIDPQPTVGVARAAVSGLENLSVETEAPLSGSLGQAVAQCWSTLPQDVQHELFEAAVAAQGETIRPLLAVFLHGKHARTLESLRVRATPEPDSLGG